MLITMPMQRRRCPTPVDSESQAGFPFRISFCTAGDCRWAKYSLVAWLTSSLFLLPFSLVRSSNQVFYSLFTQSWWPPASCTYRSVSAREWCPSHCWSTGVGTPLRTAFRP